MTESGNSALRRFLASEALGGWLLIGAAALALIAVNCGLAAPYRALLEAAAGPLTVRLWINDALMAVFFLLVGIEIRREVLDGSVGRLPLIAAAAGMAVPALIFLAVVGGDPTLASGWAIPAATDIAFALAVLALLGRRVPASLRLFLATVAIADDLGAVAIIAIAYTGALNLVALGAAAAILLGLWLARPPPWLFVFGAVLLWCAMLLSGVHATIAGVLAAAVAPRSLLHRLEIALAPWVGWLIVPLFGFANAGVAFGGAGAWLAPLPLAVALGLFVGKQAGIFGAVRLCARFGVAPPPRGASWLHIYGVSLLCGIGFTMSLFIGALAFPGRPALVEEAKIGILLGSLLSAVAGYVVLRFADARASD